MWSAIKWGAITGLAAYLVLRIGLTLLAVALFGAGPADLDHPGTFSAACLGIFALLFAFSAAGYYTGRETLRAGLGALAGTAAFAVYAALSALYAPGNTGTPATTAPAGQPLPVVAQVLSSIVAALVVIGVAALMGWLGGRPGAQQGRRRASVATSLREPETPAKHTGG